MVISYLVSCGVLDKLTVYFNNVRDPIDGEPSIAEFLQHAMGLLGAMTRFISTTSNRLVQDVCLTLSVCYVQVVFKSMKRNGK